jgi:DNA-binding NarL/FixJ family response regulator
MKAHEEKILELIHEGYSIEEIARIFNVSAQRIEMVRDRILKEQSP